MSTQKITMADENIEEYTDNSDGVVSDYAHKRLKIEYEKSRQQVYDLKRKLELNEAMLREVQEANESLERSLDQRAAEKEKLIVRVREEKHRTLAAEYENTISMLETKLAQQAKEMEELRERAAEDVRAKLDTVSTTNRSFVDSSLEADNVALRSRIDELLSIQQEERRKFQDAEETIQLLKSRCDEFESYMRRMKEEWDEKDRALEDLRGELALKRVQDSCLGMEPISESRKGNSLFAEVEDRRQNVVSKMNVLHEKYSEIKRAYKSQIAKTKLLKTEHIAKLRKWENEAGHAMSENEDLLQKYKSRISDLENKLKSEIRRNDESKQPDATDGQFGYLRSLLDAKKKETDQLRIKVEDLSTKLLVQEETKINIAKELQYWRYKATSLEAQMSALQAEFKLGLIDNAEFRISKELDEPESAPSNVETIEEKRSSPQPEDRRRLLEAEQTCESRDRSFNFIHPASESAAINNFDNKRVNKLLRFNEDTISEENGNSEKPTANRKYPVVYIPTEHNDQ